jgi:hypothetical protein
MERLAGVGIVNLIVIWLFVVFMIVGAKAILTKHRVAGLSELILSV